MAGRVVSDPNAPVPIAPPPPAYQQPYDQSTPSYYSPPGINLPRPTNVNRGRYDTGQILVNPNPGVTPTVIQGGFGPNADSPPQTYASPPDQGALPPLDPNQQNFEQMDLHDWLAAQAANPTASPLALSLATTQSKMAQYQPGGGAYDPALASQSADGYSFVSTPNQGTTLPPNVIDQIYPNGPPPVPPPPTDGYPQTYPGWGDPGGPTPPPGWVPPTNWDKYYTPPPGYVEGAGWRNQGPPPQFDPFPSPYPNTWPRDQNGQPYVWPNIPPGFGAGVNNQLVNPYVDWLKQQSISNSGWALPPGSPLPSWWYPYQLPPWGGTGDPPAPPPDPNSMVNPNIFTATA